MFTIKDTIKTQLTRKFSPLQMSVSSGPCIPNQALQQTLHFCDSVGAYLQMQIQIKCNS